MGRGYAPLPSSPIPHLPRPDEERAGVRGMNRRPSSFGELESKTYMTTESSVISRARSTISNPSASSSLVIQSGGFTKKLFQRTNV